jgi:hypothetical protein
MQATSAITADRNESLVYRRFRGWLAAENTSTVNFSEQTSQELVRSILARLVLRGRTVRERNYGHGAIFTRHVPSDDGTALGNGLAILKNVWQ